MAGDGRWARGDDEGVASVTASGGEWAGQRRGWHGGDGGALTGDGWRGTSSSETAAGCMA